MVSGIQTIDTNHEDMIHDAQLDYYGTTLATASSDHSVKIFDIRSKKQVLIAHLREHQGPVWSLSWSHPMYGSLLASCGYDRKVIIWQEISGRWGKVFEYCEHASSVNCVCWAPHSYGLMLACGSSDGAISILVSDETHSWRAFRISDAHSVGVNSVSWAPSIDAEFIFNPSLVTTTSNSPNHPIKRFVSGGCDSLIKIWREDISSGNPEWVEETRLDGHTDWVRDVAWCPSLNISRQLIASCGQDGRLIIWQSTNNDNEVRMMNTSAVNNPNSSETESKDFPSTTQYSTFWRPTILYTYSDVVWNVSWSVTGNILAVSGGDNKVTLWKENLEGNWIALSEIARGNHGASSLIGADENSQTSNQSTTPLAA
ncbi:hypothetical protein MN116_003081 [Schistosoma mekongi]|uniref:Protein SEC13 homolog n=1 Tax=Schistosoma mekongi TaxID=38744 RepID=A0AAE2D891_SCHME|nr:hypothetical protein MN116_003081 [Schistosoma mekongi]